MLLSTIPLRFTSKIQVVFDGSFHCISSGISINQILLNVGSYISGRFVYYPCQPTSKKCTDKCPYIEKIINIRESFGENTNQILFVTTIQKPLLMVYCVHHICLFAHCPKFQKTNENYHQPSK